MANQFDVRGCPSCEQLLLSGYSSCLPFVSLFHVVPLLGGLFYRSDLLRIEPGDLVVWMNGPVDPDVWLIDLVVQAVWTTDLVVLAIWMTV